MNAGKKFENAIKDSIPSFVLYHRLKDSTGTFSGGANLRFSSKQPCDMFLWNGETRTFYTLELKSTKSNSFTWEDITLGKDQPNKMIHKHQILALMEFGKYKGCVSGFIFNFRDEKNNTQKTYFQNIDDFMKMYTALNKKSFNESDLLKYNPLEIEGHKKRTLYTWNLHNFLRKTALRI